MLPSSGNSPMEKEPIVEPVVKKPPLDPAMFKIIKGEKTVKSVASIPER